MPFRTSVTFDDRRAALEELRTAHRILIGCKRAPLTVWTALLDLLRMSAVSPFITTDIEDNGPSEIEHARACVRRGLRCSRHRRRR